MEDYEVVEMYEEAWPKLPKNVTYERKSGREKVVGVAYESPDGLWICQEIRIGIRGGLSEHLVVIDPEEKITSNRLICAVKAAGQTSGNGILITLSDLRKACYGEDENMRFILVLLKVKSQFEENRYHDRQWWKNMVGNQNDGQPLFPTATPFPFVVKLLSGNYGSGYRR